MTRFNELYHLFEGNLKEEIESLAQRVPSNLYEPIRYSLQMGGKRIRPVLLLYAYQMYGKDLEKAMHAAIAIELFHNFTLLHDDMMDNSFIRRNKPTVHIRFSDNAALLSGDAMSILSYEYLSKSNVPNYSEIIQHFTQTALQVCEGQQYDMDFETTQDVSVGEYLKMIGLKTAVLLACSLKLGALIAGAPDEDTRNLYLFGSHLGLAFQLQDDYLDTFGNQESFGKKIGNDIVTNKKTYLLLKALELAPKEVSSELIHWITRKEFDPDEKINRVSQIFSVLGVSQESKKLIEYHYLEAKKYWDRLDVEEDKKLGLWEFAKALMDRQQ